MQTFFNQVAIVTQATINHFDLTPEEQTLLEAQSHRRYLDIKDQGWSSDKIILDHDRQTEHDDFDTESTVYFMVRKNDGSLFGFVRINPYPYMLEKPDFAGKFQSTSENPKLVAFIENRDDLVHDSRVWEGSRAHFDLSPPKEERRLAITALTLAKAEFMRIAGINEYIGMMAKVFWKSVFEKNGWTVEPLGQEVRFSDKSLSQAARYWMDEESYRAVRRQLGLQDDQFLLQPSDDGAITQEQLRANPFSALGLHNI